MWFLNTQRQMNSKQYDELNAFLWGDQNKILEVGYECTVATMLSLTASSDGWSCDTQIWTRKKVIKFLWSKRNAQNLVSIPSCKICTILECSMFLVKPIQVFEAEFFNCFIQSFFVNKFSMDWLYTDKAYWISKLFFLPNQKV